MIEEPFDCRERRKLGLCKNCSGKDWYSYGEIFFCRPQMIFLIEHLGELSEDKWPESLDGSSYVDIPITKKQFRSEAYFCKPREILAAVMMRLGKTGEDGVTLMEDIQGGITEYRELKTVAKRALNYISGLRRRKTSYADWKKTKKYYQKVISGDKRNA